jgi:hypothetical protein
LASKATKDTGSGGTRSEAATLMTTGPLTTRRNS